MVKRACLVCDLRVSDGLYFGLEPCSPYLQMLIEAGLLNLCTSLMAYFWYLRIYGILTQRPDTRLKVKSFPSFSFVFLKVILWPSVIVSALVASPGFGRAIRFGKTPIMIRIVCHCSGCKLRRLCRDVCLLMRCQTRTNLQQVTRSKQTSEKVQMPKIGTPFISIQTGTTY